MYIVTRTRSLFDDRPAEVQELTDLIKQDLATLNRQIADLQAFAKSAGAASRPTSPTGTSGESLVSNRQSEEHASIVVMSLQSKLASVSSSFTRVLDARTQNIKAQKDRREQFSATNIISGMKGLYKCLVLNADLVSPQQSQLSIPPSSSIPSTQLTNRQPSPRSSAAATLTKPTGHVAIELPGDSGPKHKHHHQQQQLALMQETDTAYLETRSNALSTIEATITELGLIYQQLAHMVAEQGEMVQRIDANIEDVHVNVMRGQDQLMRYLRGVSSNRWLLVKIFSAMVVFAFIFIVFFA